MTDLQSPGAGKAYRKEFDRAVAFQKQGRIDDAAALYRVLVERYPNAAEAHINLGNLLINQSQFERARQHFSTAVGIAPHLVEAHNGLAISLNRLGDKDAAADRLKVALGIAPNNPHILNNLANLLREGGKRDEAEKMYRAAVSIDPKFVAAHHSLGLIAKDRRDFAAAVRYFEDAIAGQADHAEAHFSLGMARLALGDFRGGWPEYEWRWKCGHFPGRQITGTPWQGQNLAGKTLLLHAEQGYGDTIQFFRFAKTLKQRGASIIAYCQRKLKRVVATIPGINAVVVEGEPMPAFDYYVAALSVPAVLDIGLPDLPGRIPYVKEPTGYDRRFDSLLSATQGTFRIGIAWAGRASHENDRHRSCSPDQFRRMADQSGVSLISLQRERSVLTGDLAASIVDTAALLDDFGDTAALIARLDLVIAVDTAVAHLAGAMGKPIWILLPYIPDWRWMLEVAESPWYPTARLFRQPAPGDWSSVFGEVDRQLAEFRSSRSEIRTDTKVIELASAFKRSDGSERFVMPIPDAARGDPAIRYLMQHERDKGGYEYATRCFIDAHLRANDVFIDVGAHWGIFSLSAATARCGDVRVVAIEPHPTNVSMLKRWCTRNGLLDRIEIVESAVGDIPGHRRLRLNTSMGHWIATGDGDDPRPDGGGFEVPVSTLDQIVRERADLATGRIVIKIDVEGMETEVLAGAETLLASGRVGFIIFEKGLSYQADRPMELLGESVARLEGHGFRVMQFEDEYAAGPLVKFRLDGPPCNIIAAGPGETLHELYGVKSAQPVHRSETARRKAVIEKQDTDIERWSDPAQLDPAWNRRARHAIDLVPAGSIVLDLGCGAMALERLLPFGCAYIPCDIVRRDERTLVCDLNKDAFPDAPTATHVVALGVLEYIYDLPGLFDRLRAFARPVILSYSPFDTNNDIDRSALGWVNRLSQAELLELIEASGFWVRTQMFADELTLLLSLEPATDSEPARKPSVVVLSYSNAQNFGDRLGFHLLNTILPAEATVHFVHFEPWDPPDGEIDLVLCGIGNSMFANTLNQELLRFVERARHAVGIFGTQYRTRIDPVLMAGLLDRLDLWFARYREDALIYGKGRSNVSWLGDWLIDAFPINPWTRDERLDLTSVRLEDIALDRAIQHIQTYREVISPRIHPLLCALTSAERCAYVEQYEDGSGEASGKFRSQLLDIFGRVFPERTMFDVDSEQVAKYKSKVRQGIADLRERIHGLLSGG